MESSYIIYICIAVVLFIIYAGITISKTNLTNTSENTVSTENKELKRIEEEHNKKIKESESYFEEHNKKIKESESYLEESESYLEILESVTESMLKEMNEINVITNIIKPIRESDKVVDKFLEENKFSDFKSMGKETSLSKAEVILKDSVNKDIILENINKFFQIEEVYESEIEIATKKIKEKLNDNDLQLLNKSKNEFVEFVENKIKEYKRFIKEQSNVSSSDLLKERYLKARIQIRAESNNKVYRLARDGEDLIILCNPSLHNSSSPEVNKLRLKSCSSMIKTLDSELNGLKNENEIISEEYNKCKIIYSLSNLENKIKEIDDKPKVNIEDFKLLSMNDVLYYEINSEVQTFGGISTYGAKNPSRIGTAVNEALFGSAYATAKAIKDTQGQQYDNSWTSEKITATIYFSYQSGFSPMKIEANKSSLAREYDKVVMRDINKLNEMMPEKRRN